MVLIKWIETLHSITNVNILKCVPRFLEKLFSIVEYSQNTDKQPIKNEVAKKSLEQLGLFLEDFRQQNSRSLELDKEIIVELNKFLKDLKAPVMGKGLYEALYWLNKFIQYFEDDYNIWLEEAQDMLREQLDDLSEEDQFILQEQKKFLDKIFKEQFPDIIEIILIYSQRKQFQELVQKINKRVLKLVLEIMKDKNDFENIFKKLKNEFTNEKNSKGVFQREQANTREIIVNWYIVLFKNFDMNLIDTNKDIFITLIESINFEFPSLVQKIIDLVCMLSVKNEEYFRNVMSWLI
mgnify:CR=1 FL=1